MPWRYRQGVHAAAVGRDLVLLDLVEDAYFCVPDAGQPGDSFHLDPGELEANAQGLLRDAGLIVPGLRQGSAPPLPSKATRDLTVDMSRPLPVNDILSVLAARADLRRAGPDPTVSALLAAAGSRSEQVQDEALVFRLATAFDRLTPWLPGSLLCLQRAALLRRMLTRHHQSADWVFGVRTWPFRAHCWLQFDGVCLTDDAERLRAYTPILVQ